MGKRYLQHPGWRILTAALIALSVGGWTAVQPVAAGELDKLDTSLKLIPANAAFYSSMLRNREQVEAFMNSNAYAKIMSMPSVQMGLAMYNAQAQQPGSPVARFQEARQNPEVKKLINLAADMGSNEIFVYGGENFSSFVELMQCIVSKMRYGPAVLQATGEAHGLNGDKMHTKLILEVLIDHMDLVEFPNVLVGFHLKKPAAANEALIKLETILNLSLEVLPNLKGHLNKETIGGQEYLVLRLDGKLIPWEKVPLDEWKKLVENEADLDKLVEHVKKMELVISMGVRENDLLVSIGSSVDCIKNLGAGERLIDLPEFKPLEKFIDKRLTEIGYISKELNEQINNNPKNIDDLRDFLVQMTPLAKLSDKQSDQITKDVESLADDLKNMLPEMGAITSFGFMTDKVFEGYSYNWGEHPDLDSSKPLELLKHVGGNPILGIVGRYKESPKSNDNLDKMTNWAKVGWKYMEELALPRLPENKREKAEAIVKDLKPLLQRLHTAIRDMLMPALEDGQIGLVIDANLKSKQLVKTLPELQEALPVPEPALVLGVSNAELLRKAMSELYAISNELIVLIRKYNPQIPPDFKLPEAKVAQISDGSVYSYPLPEAWGVDKNIVPNAGLSHNVAVLSISTKQTELLLKDTPLKVGGLLSETDHPLAVAGLLDWNELIGVATPWVNYALEHNNDAQTGGQKESVIAQVHTVLEVLSTIKSITSESYIEGDSLVHHSLLEIHDLGK